eukprot:403336346
MRIHQGYRPFQCDICPMKFNSRGNKSDHMRRHINQRNYECELCGQKYYRRYQLAKHLDKKHQRECKRLDLLGSSDQKQKILKNQNKDEGEILDQHMDFQKQSKLSCEFEGELKFDFTQYLEINRNNLSESTQFANSSNNNIIKSINQPEELQQMVQDFMTIYEDLKNNDQFYQSISCSSSEY